MANTDNAFTRPEKARAQTARLRSRLDPYHNHPPLAVLWGAAIGGLLLFALIAVAVRLGWTDGLDRTVLLALRDPQDVSDAWGPVWFEETATEMTALGGYPILVTISAATLTVLALMRNRAAALFLAGGLIGGTLLSSGLKRVFERARPDLVDHMDRTFTSSFPSAHAMVSMLFYLTLAAVAVRFIPRHSVRVFVVSEAFAIAIIVGASRVYLGVHWPSDVLAGWSLGIGWASLCWLAAHYLSCRSGGRDTLGHSKT
ncbi:phosphatase PAP2 family protein [Oricola sp.]|uniref:phosphatase PAP2 family protein n=1 Tax=Oricola sp. TaxID=1979950 RepID=UPI0025CD4B9D|nr:phosphatase PAP2 family protein [Oricola sp.]MCI5074324.1 phosphatase PAP2 family protein [Oricola sp.]